MVSVPEVLVGRMAITDIRPVNTCGTRAAAAAVGERIPISATIFREGHDALAAEVMWHDANGQEYGPRRMTPLNDGQDTWQGAIRLEHQGLWHFTIRAWSDPWTTWKQRAEIKIPAGQDVDRELADGAHLLREVSSALPRGKRHERAALRSAAKTMCLSELPAPVRLAAATDPTVTAIVDQWPIRELATDCGPWPLLVQRRRALVGSWYEFFPRSEGAIEGKSGTLRTAQHRLPAIAEMGFDVVYLPPIHPIGITHRKGPNNSLTATKHDPGSPWAIGSDDGGHDAIHPELGTFDDFDAFVEQAKILGIEIALDLALQASPDHPWVKSHPEWFTQRSDGTIAYAENPPKKYQDIYPLNFDNDPEGLYREVERIVLLWVSHGVNIFRVDNPHTKPLWVWERLITNINASHPDVIFLAEAFTRPAMMRALAQVGFQQSYTYFTWRNDSSGLRQYCEELAGPAAAYMRPNFFTNTPDILPDFLQTGGPSAFAIRATLAATLSPTYGIYSGFELYEHIPVKPGSEEYLDSEKYQLRPRDWHLARRQHRTLAPYLTLLNKIRQEHPALQDLRSLMFHPTNNPQLLAFSKHDKDDLILVVCSMDPHHEQRGIIWWNMTDVGLPADHQFLAHDLLRATTYTWSAETYVEIRPWEQVAHVAYCPDANEVG
jgi:starch synthase (maltosyl-transferring)